MPLQFEHVGVGVPAERWDQTVRFYEDRLGFRRRAELIDANVVLLSIEDGPILELFEIECSPLRPHHLGFVLPAPEWQTLVEEMRREPGLAHEVRGGLGGRRYVGVRDPAGNLCQLIESPPPT